MYHIPIRGEQLLASLQTQASISGADDGIAEWNLILASNFSNNLLQIIVFYFSWPLPRGEVSHLSIISIWKLAVRNAASIATQKKMVHMKRGEVDKY